MARGGKRTPKSPAAVSGPGALSRRTDGGPGSPGQPIRVPTGGDYGEASALREAQQGAPLEAGNPNAVSQPSGGPPPIPVPSGGVFGPTERPMEAPTAGMRPSRPSYDVDDAISALYSVFPHPQLLSLMRYR